MAQQGFTNRPYQEDALRATVRAVAGGLRAGLIVMPTGSGKTVVLVQAIDRLRDHGLIGGPDRAGSKVLILAHRDELLEQTKQKILRVNPRAKVGIEKAKQVAGPTDDVVLASVQTLGRRNSPRLEKFDPSEFGLVITDEAHHAAARSYKIVYSHFRRSIHLGFTATPFRGDSKSLGDVFEDVIYQRTLREMMEEGWLARARVFRRETQTDISNVKIRKGEYVAGELEDAVNTPERNELIVNSHFSIGDGGRTIVFCAGVQHGQDVHDKFWHYGVKAGFIHGGTSKEERRAILDSFKCGYYRVLVNVMVLTEGFDEPLIKNIILARPTRSPLVYAQQLGRALRIPEKGSLPDEARAFYETAHVIDIADAGRTVQTMNALSLFKVNKDVNANGEDVIEMADAFAEADVRGFDCQSVQDLEKLKEDGTIFEIPVLDRMVKRHSTYAWQEMSDGSFFLPLPNRDKAQLYQDVMGRHVLEAKLGGQEHQWRLNKRKQLVRSLPDADLLLNEHCPRDEDGRPSIAKLEWFWLTKKWGRMPATDAQLRALARFKVTHKRNLQKGEASLLLSRVISLVAAKKVEHV